MVNQVMCQFIDLTYFCKTLRAHGRLWIIAFIIEAFTEYWGFLMKRLFYDEVIASYIWDII